VKIVYAETSAVLRWLLGEKGLPKLGAVMSSANKVVTSYLTALEANRGILRAERQQRVTSAASTSLKELLARTTAQWDLLEITPGIRIRAGEPFPVEPVRTLDAIHLATALQFARVFPGLPVLTYDERILANLEPLGLTNAAI